MFEIGLRGCKLFITQLYPSSGSFFHLNISSKYSPNILFHDAYNLGSAIYENIMRSVQKVSDLGPGKKVLYLGGYNT
jgi:hypothetical protein